MANKLTIENCETENSVEFLFHIDSSSYNRRIKIENVTEGYSFENISVSDFEFSDGYIYCNKNSNLIKGYLNGISKEKDVSIYASTEDFIENKWILSSISAFYVQFPKSKDKITEKIIIDSSFVDFGDVFRLNIESSPYETICFDINGREIYVKTNGNGFSSYSIKSDYICNTDEIQSLLKIPIIFSKKSENYSKKYNSGIYINIIPEKMKVLQSTNDLESPSCAIFDPSPGPGLKLESKDQDCFSGSVVGEFSVFNTGSSYKNSHVGFCSEINKSYVNPSDQCRIYNKLSSTILPDGTCLSAFASQSNEYTSNGSYSLASRIYISKNKTSLDVRGNPVRNGTIIRPYSFYHSIYISNPTKDDIVGIEIRLENGISYEIRYTVESDDQVDILYKISELINENSNNIFYDIKSLEYKDRIDIYSNLRFSVVTNVYREDQGETNTISSVELNTNRLLEVAADIESLSDVGSHVVFLNPSVGHRSYEITGRSSPDILRLDVPDGLNNSKGPTILENYYCQSFVVVDESNTSAIDGLSDYMVLPFILDKYQRTLPLVNPSITSRKDYSDGNIYVYVVAQGIVDDIYQLFMYSFRLGSDIADSGKWIQITSEGENHNPKVTCDNFNNVHIAWESDRNGPSQIYYGILGHSSSIISNQSFVACIDKDSENNSVSSIVTIDEPSAIQSLDKMCRLIGSNGKVSIMDYQSFVVSGNAKDDEAMVCFDLSKDENGNEFDASWSQMSFQVSFDISFSGLENDELSDFNINSLFEKWKSSFVSLDNYKYKYNNNIYTIKRTDRYYEGFIPLVGSYKIDQVCDLFDGNIEYLNGDNSVLNYSDVSGNKYISNDNYLNIAHKSDLKHFVIGIVPEKVKFISNNTETFSEYCTRNSMSYNDCSGFENERKEEYYTGRYKMCAIISSASSEYQGSLESKNYNIVRLFGNEIVFSNNESHNVKVCVHYTRSNEEYIVSAQEVNRFVDSDKLQFFGDISVFVDDKSAFGHSFIADFSDQFRRFNIGFGIPSKDGFMTNESLPYNANTFEDMQTTMIFDNVCVGPHSVRPNNSYIKINDIDRNVEQMVIPYITEQNNLIVNSDFEISTISPGSYISLTDNDQYILGWDIIGGINYSGSLLKPYKNNRCVWLQYEAGNFRSDFKFSDEGWSIVVPHDGDLYGATAGTYGTTHHSRHSSFDDGYIYSYNLGSGVYYWASSLFVGDASSSYGGSLFFRMKCNKPTSVTSIPGYDVMIESSYGDIIGINVDTPDTDDWINYSIPIDVNAGWKISSYTGTFVDTPWLDPIEQDIINVLSNINRILIRATYDISTSQYVYIDSVSFMNKSGISQSVQTTIGERYYLQFAMAAVPVMDVYGPTKRIKVEAGDFSQTFDLDISDSYVNDINEDVKSKMRWIFKEIEFYATQELTDISFLNVTGLSLYSICIDSVSVVNSKEFRDEFFSPHIYDVYGLDENEYNLHYGLLNTNNISSIPVTLPSTYVNKNVDISIDNFGKFHLSWESNRNNFWDIFYSGNEYRYLPFRYETRITDSESNSLNPSISIDRKGRKCIAWHDNRDGYFQIYSAFNKNIDSDFIDQCKVDEAVNSIRNFDNTSPYSSNPYDSYGYLTEVIGCNVSFDFDAPENGSYDFCLYFYSDTSKKNIVKTKRTSDSIDGWYVDDEPFGYGGIVLQKRDNVNIEYKINGEDDLSGKVLYVEIEYKTKNIQNPISSNNDKIIVLDKSPSLSFNDGITESSSYVYAVVEYRNKSEINIPIIEEEDISTYNDNSIEVSFGDVKYLSGCKENDSISSIYVHFDPSGDVGETGYIIENVVLRLNEPIVGILWKKEDLEESDKYFSIEGVPYSSRSNISEQPFTDINISNDRMTLSFSMKSYNDNASCFRIITSSNSSLYGTTSFSFYCPSEQPERCSVDVSFTNKYAVSKNVHFRITAYSDSSQEIAVMSNFSLNSPLKWVASNSPIGYSGIEVQPGDVANLVFNPDIIPLDSIDIKNNSVSDYLICGVTYYLKVESYIDGYFETISDNVIFHCNCSSSSSYLPSRFDFSSNWICSGQGKDDIRITSTDNNCINVNTVSAKNDLFYFSWQDYRYYSSTDSIGHDYFYCIYDSENDVVYSSSNFSFDRRITDDSHRNLFNHNMLVDQFQNINFTFNDKNSIYYTSCSTGCVYEEVFGESIYPCMFTDNSFSNSYYNVGSSPERYTNQYQQIRIHKDFISFSTYQDLNTPISVVDDCFVLLDVIGVPGTYAYRLKNEDSDNWSEWLPIDSDISNQNSDTSTSNNDRSFFKAYFVDNERFFAPWICSSGNGLKRVCCEILTYFGKTESFCFDFMALYNDIKYSISYYYDSDFTKSLPLYNGLSVASNNKTETNINVENLISIAEETSNVNGFYIKITFEDKDKINRISSMKDISLFSHLEDFSVDVLQQGLNDYYNLPLEKVSDGVYRCYIEVNRNDGLFNSDGLAYIKVNIPGQCKEKDYSYIQEQLTSLLNSKSLDQKITIYNNMTVFKEKYKPSDIFDSFGDYDYYKGNRFNDNNTIWFGNSSGSSGSGSSGSGSSGSGSSGSGSNGSGSNGSGSNGSGSNGSGSNGSGSNDSGSGSSSGTQ